MSKRGADGAPRLLSCQRCRIRKIKCNLQHPCSSCVKSGTECIVVTSDKRASRPTAKYVIELESNVSHLKEIIGKLQNAPPEDHDLILKSLYNKETASMPKRSTNLKVHDDINDENLESEGNSTKSSRIITDHEVKSENGGSVPDNTTPRGSQSYNYTSDYLLVQSTAVYGPTSVYNDRDIVTQSSSLRSTRKSKERSIDTVNSDPDIVYCVKTFFAWQYPDVFMFIFREAFLVDFFEPKPNSVYCSRALVLAICALGARMSELEHIRGKAHQYYVESRSLLFSTFDHPTIANLQSFLLLSFYDICNGNNSSGWMLSGCAIRMGFDIGFQLDPELWFVKSNSQKVLPLELAIRSRIYWGCYMSDHFILLILGRPLLLKMSDSLIQETNYLPDLEAIDEYMYQDPTDKSKSREELRNISNPLRNIVKLINISERMLTDIFTKTDDDGENDDINIQSRLRMLSLYNSKIMEWRRDLSPELSWTREKLEQEGENPVLQCIRCYYYILLLCLNRPFVAVETSESPLPWTICTEVIDDIHVSIRRFRDVHGLRKASILIVYCSILSISVLLLSNSSKELLNYRREKLNFFLDVLKGCSKTWNLAEKSHKLIKIKLKAVYEAERGPKPPKPNSGMNNNNQNAQMQTNGNSNISHSPTDSSRPINYDRIDELTDITTGNSDTLEGVMEKTNSISSIPSGPVDLQDHLEFFGGPPVLMTSDLFNEDWESLFPDYNFNANN